MHFHLRNGAYKLNRFLWNYAPSYLVYWSKFISAYMQIKRHSLLFSFSFMNEIAVIGF